MSKYVDDIHMVTETCCNCGIVFAMTERFRDERWRDQKYFYCPSGHAQHYSESSEAKLKRQLAKAEQAAQRQQQRALEAEVHRKDAERKYGRIRNRIKNGVCPCCNRTFENVARHMSTKHPDFGKHQALKHIRAQYGLTQYNLADELGVSPAHISRYENEHPVSDWVNVRIDEWVESQ